MILETKRLILRPWKQSDALDLYEYAKDPVVGLSAGWLPHTSVENSLEIIKNVLAVEGTFALFSKENQKVIGSISLMNKNQSNLDINEDEAELGYWIGVPFWGRGLIPEASKRLIQYGFEELKLNKIWSAYFDENVKSKRVQEKCGFKYQYKREHIYWQLIDAYKNENVTCIIREEWMLNKR